MQFFGTYFYISGIFFFKRGEVFLIKKYIYLSFYSLQHFFSQFLEHYAWFVFKKHDVV